MKPIVPEGYEVRISHFRNEELLPEYDIRTRTDPIHAITVADIFRIEDDTLVASGQSHCSKLDPFSKRMGRDIATGRAIKILNEALEDSKIELKLVENNEQS